MPPLKTGKKLMGTQDEIAAYGEGTLSISDLQKYVETAWQNILANPALQEKASQALEISPDEVASIKMAPVRIEAGRSGIGAGDFAMLITLWIGQDILLASFKDLLKEEVKKRVKRLWLDVIEPTLRATTPHRDSLGPRSDKS
jgi:hypothetical protein